MAKKYIGILGGSFNPVHSGHIQMARAALSHIKDLDEVWMVPALRNPLKDKEDDYVSYYKRWCMVEDALPDDEPEIKMSPAEEWHIARKLNKDFLYTVELLENLPEEFTYTLIVGSDCIPQFKKWHEWERILHIAGLIVMQRPGHPLDMSDPDVADIMSRPNVKLVADENFIEVSSTQIRDVLSKVPAKVLKDIVSYGLYGVSYEK